jgi:hypothetical protein
MARLGLLDSIGGQKANGVGKLGGVGLGHRLVPGRDYGQRAYASSAKKFPVRKVRKFSGNDEN